jgi:hypothetical protein
MLEYNARTLCVRQKFGSDSSRRFDPQKKSILQESRQLGRYFYILDFAFRRFVIPSTRDSVLESAEEPTAFTCAKASPGAEETEAPLPT